MTILEKKVTLQTYSSSPFVIVQFPSPVVSIIVLKNEQWEKSHGSHVAMVTTERQVGSLAHLIMHRSLITRDTCVYTLTS